jgi:hypothetical protein
MWRAIALLALLGIPAPATPAPVPQKVTDLDKNTCRYEVETIVAPADNFLAPTDRLAVYRIRVWTVEKRKVSVDLGDDISTGGSFTQPEPEGKLHRAEALVIVRLRPVGKGAELEYWIKFKEGANTNLKSEVPGDTELGKAVQIKDASGTVPLRKKQGLGELHNWKVILFVE